MKKLLACGCSYTNPKTWTSYPSSKMEPHLLEFPGRDWPDFLAADLDLECINAGQNGASNDIIFNQVIKYISEYGHKEIDLIGVLWTQMFRVNLLNWTPESVPPTIINVFSHGCRDMGGQDPIIYEIAERLLDKLEDSVWIDKYIHNYFKNIIHLTQLCKSLDIKLLMGQAMKFEPISSHGWSDLCDNQYFIQQFANEASNLDINMDHFVFWPPIEELGGHAMQSRGRGVNTPLAEKENRISDTDWHPNAKGHRIIADYFLKKYNEIY